MYFRQFNRPPEAIIQNGKAIFGTYLDLPQKLGIKGMKAPYAGIPLPVIISKLRIKSRLNFIFSIDDYIGMSEFFDFRIFGLAELVFWNKETNKKYVYHTVVPTRRHYIPLNSDKGICASYQKRRYFKLFWGRKHQHFAFSFRVKGDSARPNAEGFFFSPIGGKMHTDCLFVSPSPASSRCSATWFAPMNINGHISFNKEPYQKSTGLGALVMNRTYFKMHSIYSKAWGLGTINSQDIIFQLGYSNLDAADSDKYNDNVLIVDGEPTALPSVVITHPFGISKKWVIQDTESMVDLTFTPRSLCSRLINIIFFRRSYTSLYGTFDGVIMDSKEQKYNLKNFPGVISRSFLRTLI